MKKGKTIGWVMLMLLMVGSISANAESMYGEEVYGTRNYTVQALLGGIRYNDLVFTDGTESVTNDMSTLPQLGGAWSTLPKGENLQYGFEATFLLGFKFDDIQSYSTAHGVYVTTSSSLWLFDIAGGVYANLPLGEKLRLYAGAGPLIMLGIYNSDTEGFASQSETSFGLGGYARTGLELKVHNQGCLGVGVRGNWSSIDFSDVGGQSDISGIAAFITYTVGL